MKKFFTVLLLLAFALSLVGCGGNGGGEEKDPAQQAAEEAARADAMQWWCEQPWYGLWTVFDGNGQYTDYVGFSWDCCALIEPNTYNSSLALLTVWDQDFNSYYDAPLAVVELRQDMDQGDAVHGALYSTGNEDNFFWDGHISLLDWVLQTEDYPTTVYIEGTITDEYGDSFEYGMLLCRWGEEWDYNTGDAPYYYESYFLPMMQAGSPLPYDFYPAEGPAYGA